jgi:transcriptional regulator with XRE-family HTH domain
MTGTNVIQQIERQLADPEYRKLFGAEAAKLRLAMALVEARKRAGLTQKELADLAGVKQPTIAALEHGDANPTIGKLGSIFALLNQTIEVSPVPLATQPERTHAASKNGNGKTNTTSSGAVTRDRRLLERRVAKGGQPASHARRMA